MALTPTDLPDPVVPAIIRCGIRARSATTDSPPMSLPSASDNRPACFLNLVAGQDLAQQHGFPLGVRHLDADHVAAWHGGDPHGDDRQGTGHVVGETDDAGAANAGRRARVRRGSRQGPGRISTMVPCTP